METPRLEMRSNSSASEATRISLNALVLAGGQSSRIGQDKALLRVGQTPMLHHVCQVAQQCTDAVYVVTPWVNRYRAIVGSGIHFIEEQTSSDPLLAQHGPLVGFAQGLAHLRRVQPQLEWVLLLACDLPYLQPQQLRDWIAQLPRTALHTIALLPRHEQGWWEALCGFYRCRCLESLEDFIPEGGRSFQRWLSHQSVQALPLSDPKMLFNCNTPNDIAKAKAQISD